MQLSSLAKGSNFYFLEVHDKQLVRLGMLAERYFADDPNTCLIKLRQFGELLAKHVAANLGILENPELTQHELLGQFSGNSVVSREAISLFHEIRKTGNKATHDLSDDHRLALNNLKIARQLAIWFHRIFKEPAFNPGPFIAPEDPISESDSLKTELERLRRDRDEHVGAAEKAILEKEAAQKVLRVAEEVAKYALEEKKVWEQLAKEAEVAQSNLVQQLKDLQAAGKKQIKETLQQYAVNSEQATTGIDLDEAATRELIDQQLREAGWEADSQVLKYSNGTRPERGRKMAIAEWPAESGLADYVLFDGLTALAVVEAKRKAVDVQSALEQAKRYSRGFLTGDTCELPGAPWGEYRIPFLFATNGRPFLQQLRTQSGIWACDVRRPQNLSQPMDGWYTPEGLSEKLKLDVDKAENKLDELGFQFDFNLRYYQQNAILEVEKAIKEGKPTALLAMATGTGKTKTCVALIYRLLKAKRFRRILFLVDRNALGEQAANTFKDTRMEGLQNFANIFGIKELTDQLPESDTKLHVSTIQGMVRRLLFSNDAANQPKVDQYDCIVVDECHRGYLLDRELSETELTFRDQNDYISKYRRVLEYFDAVKVGLTATPALQTTEIFGPPVYTYSYREAVLDGYLADHEPPFIIETELSNKGIKWKKGEKVKLYNVKQQSIESAYAPDEIGFEVEEFNKKVITESFNRVVCNQLAEHIDPNLPGKTLIFCANDRHADMVVDLLKHSFKEMYGETEDDAIKKITGKSDKPLELIRRYKNERLPNIAVTVDLLTTGIDVPEIVNLVFIRRVNSRILYEQMLGRATRKCDEIGKETFHIFDAVDLYQNLEELSTMKPVVQNPNIGYQQLIDELTGHTDISIRQQARDQFIAKFIRKKGKMSDEGRQLFESMSDMTLSSFTDFLRRTSVEDLAKWFVEHKGIGELLDQKKSNGTSYLFVSEHEDKVAKVRRGYGSGKKPEDYLKSFGDFISKNRNTIPALISVLTRPRELTREELKALALELEKNGFNEKDLEAAWQETANQAIAARIIGYVRQAALGDPLISYDQRVDNAIQTVQSKHNLNPVQKQWLTRIGNQMKKNLVVDRPSLDEGYFKIEAGGYKRLSKIFNGELDDILAELNEAAIGQMAQTAS